MSNSGGFPARARRALEDFARGGSGCSGSALASTVGTSSAGPSYERDQGSAFGGALGANQNRDGLKHDDSTWMLMCATAARQKRSHALAGTGCERAITTLRLQWSGGQWE